MSASFKRRAQTRHEKRDRKCSAGGIFGAYFREECEEPLFDQRPMKANVGCSCCVLDRGRLSEREGGGVIRASLHGWLSKATINYWLNLVVLIFFLAACPHSSLPLTSDRWRLETTIRAAAVTDTYPLLRDSGGGVEEERERPNLASSNRSRQLG
jgi:hypothetical protein